MEQCLHGHHFCGQRRDASLQHATQEWQDPSCEKDPAWPSILSRSFPLLYSHHSACVIIKER